MDSKKSLLLVLGVISGMIFVYGLDVLTTKLPAELSFDFLPWKITRYSVKAQIDSLTVIDRDGRKIPLRSRYGEDMELSCYHYHAKQTGRRVVMLELVSRKITPTSITVGGNDETAQRGPKFAGRTPAPWYVFLDFAKDGAIDGQRRGAGIRDMIVSTYYVRRLPKGRSLTRDTWSGEADMGSFITTYNWRFDELVFTQDRGQLAGISGGGEFFEEAPGGGRGGKLGSFTYSYSLDQKRDRNHIKRGRGSFDIQSRKTETGTSYREEFEQELVKVDDILQQTRESYREQFEVLREIVGYKNLGDYQAFHNELYLFLRRYPESPLWDNLLILLNDFRVKCAEEPITKEDVLEGNKPELKKEKEKKP